MTNDTYVVVGLGLGALLVVWLVFSIFKKLLGFIFLAAVAGGGFMLWNNPSLLNSLINTIQRSAGWS